MLTIGQVTAQTGLRASAIRYYESLGLLPKASRVGGKRVYEQSVLDRIAIIELAKTAGFHLDEIRATLQHTTEVGRPGARWMTAARAKQDELDAELKRLLITKYVLTRMTTCSCATLEECGRAFLDAVARHPAEPIKLKTQRRRSAKRLKPRSR